MTVDLLRLVLAVEMGLLVALLVELVTTVGWCGARRHGDQARLAGFVEAARAGLVGDGQTDDPAPALAALPSRLHPAAFTDLALSLNGTVSTRIGRMAQEGGMVAAATSLCHSRRWWRRLRGVRMLALVGAGTHIVPPLLADHDPRVRAAAAEWVADRRDGALADRLVRMLGDPAPRCRFAATAGLLRLGRASVAPLLEILTAPAAHPERLPLDAVIPLDAVLDVAAAVAEPSLLAPGLVHCRDGDPRVRSRAATLVAAIGGADATFTLDGLLADPDAGVRAAAARGLGTLGHWPAAPALAVALTDPAFDVRREAALALRRMGPPGHLYLRRALREGDLFAADMSRQVLDLPTSAPGP